MSTGCVFGLAAGVLLLLADCFPHPVRVPRRLGALWANGAVLYTSAVECAAAVEAPVKLAFAGNLLVLSLAWFSGAQAAQVAVVFDVVGSEMHWCRSGDKCAGRARIHIGASAGYQ